MLGYIGFFDILGYQRFLKNNSDETVQGKVLDFIGKAEKPGEDDYKLVFPKIVGSKNESQVKAAWTNIKWLVFSDTIVFTLEPGSTPDDELIHALILPRIACNLMLKMFDYGLPLRGALHFSQYRTSGHSLAGRGIVESYEHGKALNLSTCVVTKELAARYTELDRKKPGVRKFFDSLVCSYATPLSTGEREIRLNIISDTPKFVGQNELRDHVHRKFWAHNKDLGDARAIQKTEETERFFRFCSMLIEEEKNKHGAT